ncbi:serine/threonine-protein kinase [Rhizobium sp. CNPSo 4062]|uniref:serine/threonine protein kinase n=1 Tax=Rhizobium sp. CNPSo 4062 TaxID=3021410 RepID=UPI00254E70DF|nr:serine/threonine-protein kinase [Rhizobium sp. CNPSo 4062]MDK4706359.1 serine/threonine-protein kinase [Rhizobium sp. CNPSo 4062]
MLIAGRYEATGAMNAGGMSEAHQCQDIRLHRQVILKTLRKEQEKRRLADEQKALLKMRSSHVVQLLDVVSFEHAGNEVRCLVLEYIDGTDLKEGQFAIGDEYLQVLWQIAKGLKEIHDAGVIHRDIKPNNLRRDKERMVKIIDFGLSREVGVDNHTQAAIGYLPYMAPELLAKGLVEFSTATDVYAFAVVALSISSGGLPDWCRKRVPAQAPANLCITHLAGLDAAIATSLQQCLETDPANRPTMSEVLNSIERVLLRDRHRARVVIGGKVNELHSGKRTATPTVSASGTVRSQLGIEYDGNDFLVRSVMGEVLANNRALTVGSKLPPSCVLAFNVAKNNYYYATFDISNPEYMV